ncbi:MAG: hypothetical protein V3T84_11345, partial [Phycisphaerales bacterium]
NGGLVADTVFYIRQPTPPDTANVPPRARARARKTKQRDRGFNYRQFAAALNPELLAKLQTPRPLVTEKRGGSEGSKP